MPSMKTKWAPSSGPHRKGTGVASSSNPSWPRRAHLRNGPSTPHQRGQPRESWTARPGQGVPFNFPGALTGLGSVPPPVPTHGLAASSGHRAAARGSRRGSRPGFREVWLGWGPWRPRGAGTLPADFTEGVGGLQGEETGPPEANPKRLAVKPPSVTVRAGAVPSAQAEVRQEGWQVLGTPRPCLQARPPSEAEAKC